MSDLVILKAPEGVASVSIQGVNYDADENGELMVDAAHVAELVELGFSQPE